MKHDCFIYRRAHKRQLKNGAIVPVRESWAWRNETEAKRKGSFRTICPFCNATMIVVSMPNGGRVCFEAQAGLSRVKHFCMHLGEGIGKGPDPRTLDLFSWPGGM
jgi:hypothetical protein